MELKKTLGIGLGVLLLIAATLFTGFQMVQGTGYVGLPTTQRVATTTTVGPDTVVELFAEYRLCTARSIATNNAAITFITGDPGNGDLASTSLTAGNGLIQAASTTVTYEAGSNGCERWFALSTATGTVTLVEYQ